MVLQVGAFIQGLIHYLWILRSPLYRDRGFSNSPSTADASWFALCIPTTHIPPSTRIPGTSNESTRTHYLATLLDSYIAVLRLFYLVMNIDAASRRFLSSPAEGSVFPNEDRLEGGKRWSLNHLNMGLSCGRYALLFFVLGLARIIRQALFAMGGLTQVRMNLFLLRSRPLLTSACHYYAYRSPR